MSPESEVMVILPAGEPPGLGEMRRRLEAHMSSLEPIGCAACRWALEGHFEDEPFTLQLEAVPREHIEGLARFDEHARTACERATRGDFGVRVSTRFGDRPPWDFHRQLRLARLVAPDAVALLDGSACVVRSREWWISATDTDIPPAPTALYNLHSVTSEDGTRIWMHTHGLARCGCPELEVLDVPMAAGNAMIPLIEAVAAQWMCDGAPAPGETFVAGQDLELAWLPWEQATVSLGGSGPSHDRDESHGGAVLLKPKRGWARKSFVSPVEYTALIEGNPMFFLPDLETHRQALLAAERLPRFIALQQRFGSQPGWQFLVKLGYVVDDGEPHQREHLWFDVLGVEGAKVRAELLNAPYHVAALTVGEVGLHGLELLTDWTIFSPEGRYGVESLHLLEQRIALPS